MCRGTWTVSTCAGGLLYRAAPVGIRRTMALAFIVTLEKEIPELAAYTKAKTGKALARESDRVNSTARRKNVESISAMLSESQAVLRKQLEADGFDTSKMRLAPEL